MKNKIFTTKQLIFLFALILALIGVLGLVAFLVKDECVQKVTLWANLVLGTGAIITSSITIGLTILSMKREENLRKQRIEEQANKFISENNDEILYIPLCLIANSFDNHHKFVRKIYNNFNVLNKNVQEEVLKQLNYDYELIANNQWIDKGLDLVRNFISENDLGDDYLYDNAKYFHQSIISYPNEQYDSACEHGHFMPDNFNWTPKKIFKGDNVYDEGISFFDYLQAYVNNKKNDSMKYKIYHEQKPISVLAATFNFGNCSEEQICYWMMEIVSSITMLLIKENRTLESEINFLTKGDASIQTFEDRYLDVVMELYNLHLLLKDNKRINNAKTKKI